jgi:hypothetical protein
MFQNKAGSQMASRFSFVLMGHSWVRFFLFSPLDVMWFATCMRYTIKAVIILALVFFAGGVMAGGNKGKKVDISFHIETESSDNPKMIFPHEVMGMQRFFRRIPEVSSNDYIAFTPFPADDQASYGVILQLKDNVGRRLAAVTQISSGKWLVCKAFGRIVDGVLIEDPVEDAVLVIWKGLSLEEIRQIDESIPRIGEKKK